MSASASKPRQRALDYITVLRARCAAPDLSMVQLHDHAHILHTVAGAYEIAGLISQAEYETAITGAYGANTATSRYLPAATVSA